MQRLFETLGLRSDASYREVKLAYHREALKHHPDRGGNETRMKEVNEAYEILKDGDSRTRYHSDSEELHSGAVAVTLCTCRCAECQRFIDLGSPPGGGGCRACETCNPPSRKFKELLAELRQQWRHRDAPDQGELRSELSREELEIRTRFLPVVVPEHGTSVRLHGLKSGEAYNGMDGQVVGVQENGRFAVEVWFQGDWKRFAVKSENLRHLSAEGEVVPQFARLAAEAVRFLISISQEASYIPLDIVRVPDEKDALLNVASQCAQQLASEVRPDAVLSASQGRGFLIMGRCLQRFVAMCAEPETVDSREVVFLRMALASLQTASLAGVREPGVEAELLSWKLQLEDTVCKIASDQLRRAAQLIEVGSKGLQEASLELHVIKLCRRDQAESFAHEGAKVHDDELDKREKKAQESRDCARTQIKNGFVELSEVLCESQHTDPVVESGIVRAVQNVASEGVGSQLSREFLSAAKTALVAPSSAQPRLDAVAQAALGEEEESGLLRALARVVAHVAARGSLARLRGFRGLRPGAQATDFLEPPHKRHWACLRAGPRQRTFEIIEGKLLKHWAGNKTWETAQHIALSYIDLLRIAETAVEVACVFINAALWFYKGLQMFPEKDHADRYATKECVQVLLLHAADVARDHSHAGLQLLVSQVGMRLTKSLVLEKELGDKGDIDLLRRFTKDWVYSSRLCPLGAPPSVLLSEAVLLGIYLGKLHLYFMDGLAEADELQPVSSVPRSVVDYRKFENETMGLKGLEGQDASMEAVGQARVQCVHSMLAHHNLTGEHVQSLHLAAYDQRDTSGWRRRSKPKMASGPQHKIDRMFALFSELKHCRLTTDKAPRLTSLFGRATESQQASLVRVLSKRASNALEDIVKGQVRAEDAGDRLQRALEEMWLNKSGPDSDPDPKKEQELRSILLELATFQRSLTPTGKCFRGLTLSPNGCIQFMVEDVPGGMPPALFNQVVSEVMDLADETAGGSIFFSLDHPTNSTECGQMRLHVMQQQRCPPDLCGSEIVRLMHHCDYMMKELSTGVELNPKTFQLRSAEEGLHTFFPDYLVALLKPIHMRGQGDDAKASMHRLWIEAEDFDFEQCNSEIGEEFFMSTPNLRVRAHPLELDFNGEHRDTVHEAPVSSDAAQFARAMTLAMGSIQRACPEFKWLAEIPKLQKAHRILAAHNKELLQKCQAQVHKRPLSHQLDHFRSQVREWPHRPISSAEVLNKLAAQNPHASRSEIRAHKVFTECVNDAQKNARDQDLNTINQITRHLLDDTEGLSYHELQTRVRHWLDSSQAEELQRYVANGRAAHNERVFMTFKLQCEALGTRRGASSKPAGKETSRCWVPAAFYQHKSSGRSLLVYGGVDLGCEMRPGSFTSSCKDYWRSTGVTASCCSAGSCQGCGGGRGGGDDKGPGRVDAKGPWGWVGGLATSARSMSNQIPTTFEELRQSNPALAKKFQTRGGYRNWSEAEALFGKVPHRVRVQGEGAVTDYLVGKDASHIQAKAQGGSNAASNIVFEDSKLNRQRNYDYRAGRRSTPHMTEQELQAVEASNSQYNSSGVGKRVVGSAVSSGLVSGAVEGGLALIEEGKNYKSGEIDGYEYARRVGTKAAKGGATGTAIGLTGALVAEALPVAAAALAPVGVALAIAGGIGLTYRVVVGVKELAETKSGSAKNK